MSRALIVVDVQNDFIEGGSLAVAGGKEVAHRISALLGDWDWSFQYYPIVATHDYHINPGSHWSDEPDYIDSWPVHCEAGTYGANLHSSLHRTGVSIDKYFWKGQYSAAYSGFEAITQVFTQPITLNEYLTRRGVEEVDVVGIAYDYCVKATALDAVRLGYQTRILTDLTVPVHADSVSLSTLEHDLQIAGVTLALSQEV